MADYLTKEEVKHELDLHLTDDLVAILAIVLHEKSVAVEFDTSGDIPMPKKNAKRSIELLPTFITLDKGLSDEQRLRIAGGLVDLARTIRRGVMDRHQEKKELSE